MWLLKGNRVASCQLVDNCEFEGIFFGRTPSKDLAPGRIKLDLGNARNGGFQPWLCQAEQVVRSPHISNMIFANAQNQPLSWCKLLMLVYKILILYIYSYHIYIYIILYIYQPFYNDH